MSRSEPIRAECRLMCTDGKFRRFNAYATPVKDESGGVIRWAGLCRDVTEAREREYAQAFLLQLGDTLRQSGDPDVLLDSAARRLADFVKVDLVGFVEANPAAGTVTIVHEAVNGVLPSMKGEVPLSAFGDSAMMRAFVAGDPAIVRDVEHETRGDPVLEGYRRYGVAATMAFPILVDGRFRAVLYASSATPRDWTDAEIDTTREVAERTWAAVERARAEHALGRSREALHQSEKLTALGSLLAGVSHELNNPLSIVVAQAVMMERQAGEGALAERARHIRAAADRCARIVQTFLAMARQKTPERRRTDLNAVVNAALELTAYGLRTGGVELLRNQAPGLPAISADSDQLHQVIINLVINAQQAMQEHPGPRRLTIGTSVCDDGAAVALEVADNGPGVPAEMRRRIFEPFFTTKPQDVGTGVGLSFSQGLVEAHGGTLELLESETGAVFRVTLPVSVAAEPAVAGPVAPAAPDGTLRRALVVDDEPQIARALAEFLELEGYACDTAFGGGEAKGLLKSADYDLIVSDLRMPDVDGPSLFAWIKAERPELARRVAFSTGDTLGAPAVRFLAREGRPFMEKPFTPESLRALLDDLQAAA